MKKINAVCLFLCVTLCASAPATAQGLFGLDTEVKLTGQLYDNFFQAPDGEPKESVLAFELGLQLSRELSTPRKLRPYLKLGGIVWEKLENSGLIMAGLNSSGTSHSLDVSARYLLNRPSLDVGDHFDTADILRFTGVYSYRLSRDIQLNGATFFQSQSFEDQTTSDNNLWGIGGSVRYRGFGSIFSPEVGFITGERSAEVANEDHDQTDLYLKVRCAPNRDLYFSARLRYRTRDYSVDDALASNYKREDTRTQLALIGVYRFSQQLALDVYYTYEDADSSKDSRIFTTQLIFVGLAMAF
jgi:hypothetical protein